MDPMRIYAARPAIKEMWKQPKLSSTNIISTEIFAQRLHFTEISSAIFASFTINLSELQMAI